MAKLITVCFTGFAALVLFGFLFALIAGVLVWVAAEGHSNYNFKRLWRIPIFLSACYLVGRLVS